MDGGQKIFRMDMRNLWIVRKGWCTPALSQAYQIEFQHWCFSSTLTFFAQCWNWNQAQKNFTHLNTEYPWVSVTLSLCDSKANKPPIVSAVCHGIGPKFFLGLIGQKSMSQNIFFLRPVLGRPSTAGQKSTNLFSYLGRFTWHWAEI